MCDCPQDYWHFMNRAKESLMLLEGLVAGLRGARKKALDHTLADLKGAMEALGKEVESLHRRAYNDHHEVDSLERERRGLQKRIATIEAEHKATLAKYKAALADVAKDLINTPCLLEKP